MITPSKNPSFGGGVGLREKILLKILKGQRLFKNHYDVDKYSYKMRKGVTGSLKCNKI